MSFLPVEPIDCLPLTLTDPPEVRLSRADLRRIGPVRRELLSPLDYDGIDAWRAAVNRAVVEAFDAASAMFQFEVPGHQLCYSKTFDVEILARYGREIMPDLDLEVGLFRDMTRVGAGNRAMAWRRELGWLYASDYFNELVRTYHSFDPIWCVAPVEGARYPAVMYADHGRIRRDRPFGPQEVQLMKLLRPALEAGVQTVVRTATSRNTLIRSLDAEPHGAMVYDVEGRVLHRNPAMGRIARTRQGEKALLQAGRAMARALLAPDTGTPPAGSSVRVAGLTDRAAEATRTVDLPASRPQLHAIRMGAGMFDLRPVVLVTVSADHRPLPDRAVVADRFGLTPRQAEVGLLLADRKTNPEIAEILRITENTVGSHVEAVMRRMGVHDRREIRGLLQDEGAVDPGTD